MPQMEEYYGQGPTTFTYEDLHSETPTKFSQPVARPKSQITGEEDIAIEYGVNWEDNGAGATADGLGSEDFNFRDMSDEERTALLKFRDSFIMYLPRICNHCLNASCVAACPSGAGYKREEDGVVLIDQNRCRAWRYCISSCPYKKPYFNWRTGKMEKCILCYPRLETGQPPACFHACPGRIRYMGPLLYDIDRVPEAANAPEEDLIQAQRDIILDPHDPEIAAKASADGVSDSWIDACRRSPVYRMVKDWEIALPLHPEFRTLPCLFYIPPESPVKTKPDGSDSISMVGGQSVLPDLDDFRIPIKFLSSLFSANRPQPVKTSLLKQLAVRAFRRAERVYGNKDLQVLQSVGLTEKDARDMHRLLALAHYHERFVIPTTRRERTANAPFFERGFSGFSEMTPSDKPRRRSFFHGQKETVGS